MSNPANLGLFPNLEEVFPLYKYVSHLDLRDSRRQKEYFFDKYLPFKDELPRIGLAPVVAVKVLS